MWNAMVEIKKRGKQQNKSGTSPGNPKMLQQCCIAENNSELPLCKGKGLQVKELKTENTIVKDQVYATSNCLAYSLQAI